MHWYIHALGIMPDLEFGKMDVLVLEIPSPAPTKNQLNDDHHVDDNLM